MEQLSFGIPPELHTFLESASSPHPLLALLPIVTLILALLLAVPSASTYEALYSDDAPLPTDVEESSAKTPGEEEPRHAALYLRRGLLVASTLLTSAVLLAVSVARIGGGGEGGWMVVFDSGVAAGAVFLTIGPVGAILVPKVGNMVEIQRAFVSFALLVELAFVNALPLAYSSRPNESSTFGLLQIGMAALLVLFALVTPPVWSPRVAGAAPNPAQIASPLSLHLFQFLEPGMLSYYLWPDAKPFSEHVPPLPDVISSAWVLSQFVWTQGDGSKATGGGRGGGVAAFARLSKFELFKIFLYSIVWLVGVFVSLLSLNLLLSYVQDKSSTRFSPYLFVFGIFAAPVVSSIAYQSALYRVSQLGIRLRVVLADAVFRKVLRTREAGEAMPTDRETKDGAAEGNPEEKREGSDAMGRVNNLVGTDIDVITSSLESSLQLLGVPPKLVLSLVGLYVLLGWSAFVALLTILAFAPLSVSVSKRYGGVQEEIMKATDRRVTLIGELVSSIRVVKMFAWEKTSVGRISAAREKELNGIKKRAKVYAGMMLLSTGIPMSVTLATFGTYVFVGRQTLTASTAFTSMSLFSLLREAVISSTYLLTAFMRARVSLDRITNFISTTEEVDANPRHISSSPSISITSSKFKWSARVEDSAPFVLVIDKLEIPTGKTTIIAGDVGSGKSALLYALLGEMHVVEGQVEFPRLGVSYCSQAPWLQDDTIRNNILFGDPWDEERYNRAVFQCALEADLGIMPQGDSTLVGEKGLSISGGQKQRIALARAVYAKTEIVLLDDVLSAVDSNIVSHLIAHCLNGDLLAGRTVLLVTHFSEMCAGELTECELVVHLASGKISKLEHPSSLRRKDSSTSASSSRDPSSAPSFGGPDSQGGDSTKKDEDNDVEISWAVYKQYFRAAGGKLFWSGYVLVNGVAHVAMLAQGWWVGRWVNDPERTTYYFETYALIQLVAAFSLTVMYLYLIYGAIRASRTLHSRLTSSVFGAPIRFFDTTAQGNIINRFSRDTSVVDTEIVENTQPVFDYSVQVVFVAILVSYILPWFLIPALLVGVLFGFIGRFYIRNALAARKHVAAARSPLFSTLGDATSGVVVIRAFGRQRAFASRFMVQNDTCNKMGLYETGLERWLEERSDIVAATVSFIIGLLALRGNLSSGTTGFLVATGLEFTSRILFVVRAVNKQQLSINSADRVIKYSRLAQEPADTTAGEPPAHWPHDGRVEFQHYSARYGPESEDILHDLSFDVKPGEKVGIVGPSGCGKSSLALALLRFSITSHGSIFIDGRNIKDTNLHALRSRVTLIPQDATLFEGTLRSNLDPTETVEDAVLWSALRRSQILREDSDLSLDSHVASGGSNFSQGQRQLLSLSRAMARTSKLLILDEATASLDNETDKVVQHILREELKGCTTLTIAHRLESIMDFDRVIVLKAGRLVEFERPKVLLDRPDSIFRNMVEATGNWDKLYEVASRS